MPDQPDDLDEVKKNPKLCAALMEYMKRTQCDENFFFYFDKGNAEALYEKYLSHDAKMQVNLPAPLDRRVQALKDDFTHRDWDKLLKDCRKSIKELVESDTLPAFYQSREFEKYVRKERMGDPKKAAKLLGIENVKLLEEAMLAAAMGDAREADGLLKQLAREEHMKEETAAIRKALENYGFG